jgi:hypothetical protein
VSTDDPNNTSFESRLFSLREKNRFFPDEEKLNLAYQKDQTLSTSTQHLIKEAYFEKRGPVRSVDLNKNILITPKKKPVVCKGKFKIPQAQPRQYSPPTNIHSESPQCAKEEKQSD